MMNSIPKKISMLKLRLIDTLSGTEIKETLRMLQVHQYLPAEELDAIRQKRLDDLFYTARTSTVYYSQFSSYHTLPELTKQIMKERPADFHSSSYNGKTFKKYTGGTTGTPFPYQTSELAQSYLWAGLMMSWEGCGYEFGDRVAFIAGSALIKTDTKHKVFYKLLNVDKYPVASMDDEVIAAHLTKLRSRNTKVIYGYAMSINLIADYMQRHHIAPMKDLKGIVCTSEVLTDKMRANIENAFQVKVYNQYGCNEAGLSGFECTHGNMHLISSRCFYEINENGVLLSTDLSNDAYIFMKYNTGDIVHFSNNRCGCGRNYPVISKIEGRGNELLVDQRNKVIHSSYFNLLFKNDHSIKQYQVTFDESSVYINLKVDNTFNSSNRQFYLELIKGDFAFDRYEIATNQQFYTGKNLKHTFIIDKRKQPGLTA
jgi:phenylacetate-CoA ligase